MTEKMTIKMNKTFAILDMMQDKRMRQKEFSKGCYLEWTGSRFVNQDGDEYNINKGFDTGWEVYNG